MMYISLEKVRGKIHFTQKYAAAACCYKIFFFKKMHLQETLCV